MADQTKCQYCGKKYFNKPSKIRHIKSQHADQQQPSSLSRQNHIICPICMDNNIKTYSLLLKHFVDAHEIVVKETTMSFTCKEEFHKWMSEDKRKVNYVVGRTVVQPSYTYIYYNCKRSNSSTSGYKRKSRNLRMLKAGGSIKIMGVCPARIIVTFFDNSEVHVKYFETHVGHNEELRRQRLTRTEQRRRKNKMNHLCTEEQPEIEIKIEDTILQSVEEKYEINNETEEEELKNETQRRKILLEEILNDVSSFDNKTFFTWAEQTSVVINKLKEAPSSIK